LEALAFIEELGRNGEVIRRHALNQLPACIGRGYDADVLVDDPYVAARHLEIRLTADGELEAVDIGSLNGTFRFGDKTRLSASRIHSDDMFRIGQTQLRIRLPGQTIPAELPLPQRTWDRHPLVFAGSVVLLICFTAWDQCVNTFKTDISDIFALPITFFSVLLIWVAVWSLVCRMLHGKANFLAHGIVAFAGFSVLAFVGILTDYLNFAFDLHGFDLAWKICLAAIFAAILHRHLRLTVRLSRHVLFVLVISLAAVIFGGIGGLNSVSNANKPGLQSFNGAIKPSAFLFVKGIHSDQFVGLAEQLKENADKDAGAMTH